MLKLQVLVNKNKILLSYLVIILLNLIVFGKSISYEFLAWDDEQNILNNVAVKNFDLFSIWTKQYYGMYIPVVYTLWSVLFKIAMQGQFLFHFFNIIIHILNSILVFKICKLLIDNCKYTLLRSNAYLALIATLFFSLHPLQVEAIAWVSGSRDLLSALFALICIYIYIHNKHSINYFWLILLMTLGLLSKPSIVILPAILFFYDFLNNKKPSLRIIPFLFISAAFVYITNSIQLDQIQKFMPELDFISRITVALNTISFYLLKIIAPVNLAADYGLTPNFILNNNPLFGVFITTIFSSLIYFFLKANKLIIFGFVIFFIALLPTTGLLPFSFQNISTVADRYIYLSMLGVSIIILYIANKKYMNFFLIPMLISFCILSFKRLDVWKNNPVFYSAMLASNKNSFSANIGLGNIELHEKNYLAALDYFNYAIKVQPENAIGLANSYLALARLGRFSEVQMLSQNLLNNKKFLDKNFGTEPLSLLYSTIAYSEQKLNRPEISFKFFCEALLHNPENPDSKNNIPILHDILKKQFGLKIDCPTP